MGWCSEIESNFDHARAKLEEYPKGSVGWLEGANAWNDTAYDSMSDQFANALFSEDWPNIKLPTNCEIEIDEEAHEIPTVKIPKIDRHAIVAIKE